MTKIDEIGGEFALIQKLTQKLTQHPASGPRKTVVGIGDDAAVLETAPAPAPYLLVTTDLLVENRHFKTHWATAEQIGEKASECNVSDIAAMGGRPTWMFISLALRRDCPVQWVEGVYDGIARSCRRHHIVVAGGDTTQAQVSMINITLLGEVERSHLCLRSQARPGDILMVSGSLGASAAALALLDKGETPVPYLADKHLTPTCRLDVSEKIAPLANAMIDLSDGLGSDLGHICTRSKVSAQIEADKIPIHPEVSQAAARMELDPLLWALGGGEDFELLFSVAPENLPAISALKLDLHAIGRVLPENGPPVLIDRNRQKKTLLKGFDHFNPDVA